MYETGLLYKLKFHTIYTRASALIITMVIRKKSSTASVHTRVVFACFLLQRSVVLGKQHDYYQSAQPPVTRRQPDVNWFRYTTRLPQNRPDSKIKIVPGVILSRNLNALGVLDTFLLALSPYHLRGFLAEDITSTSL